MLDKRIQNMSWKEIEENVKKGKDTILVGIGSIEQHGMHLPIGTDSMICKKLCDAVAEKFDDILIGPLIEIGCSKVHLNFPGTISCDMGTLRQIIIEYCECLMKHGFRKIFLIPTHGGNFPVVEDVELYFNCNSVQSCFDGAEFINELRRISRANGIPITIAGSHAGELETSMMLYLYENLVIKNNIIEGFLGNYDEVRPLVLENGMEVISQNGAIGNPKLATKIMGKQYFDGIVKFICDNIEVKK